MTDRRATRLRSSFVRSGLWQPLGTELRGKDGPQDVETTTGRQHEKTTTTSTTEPNDYHHFSQENDDVCNAMQRAVACAESFCPQGLRGFSAGIPRSATEIPQRRHTVDLRCDTTVIGLVRLALPDDAAIEVAQKISQDLRRNRLG
jgi:hypothetical protein